MLAVVPPAVVTFPANAPVVSVDDRGFVIEQRVTVTSAPAATWARLVRSDLRWSSKHS